MVQRVVQDHSRQNTYQKKRKKKGKGISWGISLGTLGLLLKFPDAAKVKQHVFPHKMRVCNNWPKSFYSSRPKELCEKKVTLSSLQLKRYRFSIFPLLFKEQNWSNNWLSAKVVEENRTRVRRRQETVTFRSRKQANHLVHSRKEMQNMTSSQAKDFWLSGL